MLKLPTARHTRLFSFKIRYALAKVTYSENSIFLLFKFWFYCNLVKILPLFMLAICLILFELYYSNVIILLYYCHIILSILCS